MFLKNKKSMLFLILAALLVASAVYASTEATGATHLNPATTFLWIAVILILAKVSSLVERFGQPSVLGELIIGVLMGNLFLVGINILEPLREDSIIKFLSELGVVILLFQIGLESNIAQMKRVGVRALLVATVGVVVPFILGTYVVGPWLLPDLSSNAYLFLGATLTATSVGITARVFKDLGKLQTPEAQIVLGAAVIDDVMGLVILAVVSAIVTVGAVSLGGVAWITAKAILFLVGAIIIGQLLAPWLGRLLSKIHSGSGMKFTMAVSFGLVFAFLAHKIGLAPIVGAFAAGLVLDAVHFNGFSGPQIISDLKELAQGQQALPEKVEHLIEHHSHRHIEYLLEPLGYFLVPIFFVMTGFDVKLATLADLPVLLLALGITVAAFIGKIVSGLVAGQVDKKIVGFGMIPRGEVGLIFAMMGKSLGVVSDQVFSAIVIMVILTTLLTPPILTWLLKRKK